MALKTFSAFYYGYEINNGNFYLNFDEGSGELTASVNNSDYSFTDLLTAVETALNAAGALTYTVSADRATRIVTITAASGTFKVLGATGTNVGNDAWSLLGFSAVDTALASSHAGTSASGSEYLPQIVLQNYVGPDDFKRKIDPSVNVSASGKVESVSFGTNRFMSFSMPYITDIPQSLYGVFKNNATGVADARAFMDFLIDKGPVEFMADIDDRDTFETFILDSTPLDGKGTAYRLTEMYSRGLVDYYTTGNLVFIVRE